MQVDGLLNIFCLDSACNAQAANHPMLTCRQSSQVGAVCGQQRQLRQRGRRRLAGLAAPLIWAGAGHTVGSSAQSSMQGHAEQQGFNGRGRNRRPTGIMWTLRLG